jgi:hypothetical protein
MTRGEQNISFFVEDNAYQSTTTTIKEELDIENMRKELDYTILTKEDNIVFIPNKQIENPLLLYNKVKQVYGEDMATYYDMEHTVKDLCKICEFYGILKQIKKAKCKKQEMIATILYFEQDIANKDIVNKRHQLWSYITELMNDKRTEKYVIWE